MYKTRKIESENNIYYLAQKQNVNYTIIERIGKLTNNHKGENAIQKNIEEITLEDIKDIYFFN